MKADPDVGETNGGLQAPHVIRRNGKFLMFYGDWQHIALATSNDGKTFDRQLNRAGTVGLFDEGPGSNTRDPMVLPIGDVLYCYYTAYLGGRGADYCRMSWTNLGDWGPSKMVAFGGQAGTNPFSAECPHVVFLDGYYYLFRTQRYGAMPRPASIDPKTRSTSGSRMTVASSARCPWRLPRSFGITGNGSSPP